MYRVVSSLCIVSNFAILPSCDLFFFFNFSRTLLVNFALNQKLILCGLRRQAHKWALTNQVGRTHTVSYHTPNPTALQMWFNSYLTFYRWNFVSGIWYTKTEPSFSIFSLVLEIVAIWIYDIWFILKYRIHFKKIWEHNVTEENSAGTMMIFFFF